MGPGETLMTETESETCVFNVSLTRPFGTDKIPWYTRVVRLKNKRSKQNFRIQYYYTGYLYQYLFCGRFFFVEV